MCDSASLSDRALCACVHVCVCVWRRRRQKERSIATCQFTCDVVSCEPLLKNPAGCAPACHVHTGHHACARVCAAARCVSPCVHVCMRVCVCYRTLLARDCAASGCRGLPTSSLRPSPCLRAPRRLGPSWRNHLRDLASSPYLRTVNHTLLSRPFFKNGTKNLDLRCVLHPGAGCKKDVSNLEKENGLTPFYVWLGRYAPQLDRLARLGLMRGVRAYLNGKNTEMLRAGTMCNVALLSLSLKE